MRKKSAAGIFSRGQDAPDFNVGVVVFFLLLLYLIYTLLHFAFQKDYTTYTVGNESAVSASATYQALILRSEKVVSSDWVGYVNLFVPEGTRTAVGGIVATVDELGVYSETIDSAGKNQVLSSDDLLRLKSHFSDLAVQYDGQNFSGIYARKNEISSYFLGAVATSTLSSLQESMSLSEFFHKEPSEYSGLVSYYTDGFEKVTADTVKADYFNTEKYSRSVTKDFVEPNDFLYKIIDSEDWSLVFPVSDTDAALYNSKSKLSVTFLANNLTVDCNFRLFTAGDSKLYIELYLSKYLVQFLGDRYTKIRINQYSGSGYKVPATSVVTKEFYVVPKEYLFTVTEDKTEVRQLMTENFSGRDSVREAVTPTVFWSDDSYIYLDTNDFAEGTLFVNPITEEKYTVRLKSPLKGVYQVNKGFTVFRLIEIVMDREDYLIVRAGTRYGITTFDLLLLHPEGTEEGAVLH